MEEAIKELVAVCSPLSVVVNARGKMLDLNQFILLAKFKYEGLIIISPKVITFDLKSGYHHVDIHEDCWPYLGFSWRCGPDTKWYTFKVFNTIWPGVSVLRLH